MAGIREGANKDVAQRDLLKIQVLLADTGRGKRQASDLHIVSMLGRYSFTIPEIVALWELRPL
jgi:hypothetical protein